MRLLVTSDTHTETPDELPRVLVEAVGAADAVVHAGDFETVETLRWFEERVPVHAVHGNADTGDVRDALPRRTTFDVEDVRICVLHGHRTADVAYEAAETGATLVVRGHTHTPSYKDRTVPILNPGTPTRPKSSPPSYAWLTLEDGRFGGKVVSLRGDTLVSFGEEL